MKKLIIILLIVNVFGVVLATKSRVKRENQNFISQEFQELGRSLSTTLETKIDDIKSELKEELMETKSQLQNKLEEIASQIVALSLKEDKTELKLNKLEAKLNSCNSMITSVGKRQNKISEQAQNSNQTVSNPNSTSVSTANNGQLSAEYLGVKLPFSNTSPKAIYDGKDSIYLFGGDRFTSSDRIYKFSIASETMKQVASLPEASGYGTLQSDRHGHMFYLGGGNSRNEIYKFDPTTNTTSSVAKLPYSVGGSVSIKYNESSNTVFILGGRDQRRDDLLIFDMETFNVSVVPSGHSIYVGNSAAIRVGKEAFIFAEVDRKRNRVLKLDLDTYDLRAVGSATLPGFNNPSAVWDRKFGYIIFGGYNPGKVSTHGVFQFDPETYESTLIPLKGFQVKEDSYFSEAPASVFVPGLNRIYCFGGELSGRNRGQNEIFYIDLSPLYPSPSATNEATDLNQDFTCNNKTNGLHPHPGDCSMFIGCQDEKLSTFNCPFGLLFNSVTKGCDFPENVQCSTFCLDKPDGTYPSTLPNDCSSYIICRNGVKNVFDCPPPLLFNPERKHCDYPNLVTCSNSTAV